MDVGLLGAIEKMFDSYDLTRLIQEFPGRLLVGVFTAKRVLDGGNHVAASMAEFVGLARKSARMCRS